jgi:hypothetical protein
VPGATLAREFEPPKVVQFPDAEARAESEPACGTEVAAFEDPDPPQAATSPRTSANATADEPRITGRILSAARN